MGKDLLRPMPAPRRGREGVQRPRRGQLAKILQPEAWCGPDRFPPTRTLVYPRARGEQLSRRSIGPRSTRAVPAGPPPTMATSVSLMLALVRPALPIVVIGLANSSAGLPARAAATLRGCGTGGGVRLKEPHRSGKDASEFRDDVIPRSQPPRSCPNSAPPLTGVHGRKTLSLPTATLDVANLSWFLSISSNDGYFAPRRRSICGSR